MMKLMAKRSITPGPRDERGVLSARILTAAREAFAETGWAGTTMRAVARAADVDPALVYHYFGSKEGLLEAATNPPPRWLENVAKTWTTPVSELGSALLRLMLGAWADDEVGPVLRAVLQTAAHEPSTNRSATRRPASSGEPQARSAHARIASIEPSAVAGEMSPAPPHARAA